jgi:hypothetical protein
MDFQIKYAKKEQKKKIKAVQMKQTSFYIDEIKM